MRGGMPPCMADGFSRKPLSRPAEKIIPSSSPSENTLIQFCLQRYCFFLKYANFSRIMEVFLRNICVYGIFVVSLSRIWGSVLVKIEDWGLKNED